MHAAPRGNARPVIRNDATAAGPNAVPTSVQPMYQPEYLSTGDALTVTVQ